MKTMFVITNYVSSTHRAKVVTPEGKSLPYHATSTAGGEAAAKAVVGKWYCEAAVKTIRPAGNGHDVYLLQQSLAKPGRKQQCTEVFVFDAGAV